MSCTDLVKSISIDNLLNQRDAVRQYLETARDALAAITGLCKAVSADMPRHRFPWGAGDLVCDMGHGHTLRLTNDDGLHSALKRFDAAAWQQLLHASGMRSLMDAEARAKWDKAVNELDVPELNRANIESTFSMLHACAPDMFDRGVIECFRKLSWCYKTNQPQKFGKRIVVGSIIGSYGYSSSDRVDDLLRVLNVLDGKPAPDHRSATQSMLSAADLTYGKAGVVENEYVHVRVFKNRNGHITFKRPELVDRMNLIIAKHHPNALPAPN